jgi:hypothetical protein
VRKSTGARTAKSPVRSSRTKELTYEQVQLRAYFIGERRKSLRLNNKQPITAQDELVDRVALNSIARLLKQLKPTKEA